MEENFWRKKNNSFEKNFYKDKKDKKYKKKKEDNINEDSNNPWQVKKSNNYRKENKDNKYRRRFRNSNLNYENENEQEKKDINQIYIMFKNHYTPKNWVDIINNFNNYTASNT